MEVIYYDRQTKEKRLEKIYGRKALHLLYREGLVSFCFRFSLAKIALISKFYGLWQKLPYTKRKIVPFIEQFQVDSSEFLEPVSAYNSFNDFFCRKLKSEARPIAKGDHIAIIPADGRYLVYPDISLAEGIFVKGKFFSLEALLGCQKLAKEYAKGSLVLGRLCPIDYHRFHFPVQGVPKAPKRINGSLFSVNPIALIKNIQIFTENKRQITTLENTPFGKVLFLEVGAMCVGSIHQTHKPNVLANKGDEKGYFSFGGSSVILLFPRQSINFCKDLVDNSKEMTETFCKMGEPLGYKK